MIKRIAFAIYPVSDLERSKTFYQKVIGLPEPRMLHDTWAEFELGATTFALATGGEAIGVPAGTGLGVAFEVENLDAAVRRVKENNAPLDDTYDGATCRAAFVRDPDGNRFDLHQLKR